MTAPGRRHFVAHLSEERIKARTLTTVVCSSALLLASTATHADLWTWVGPDGGQYKTAANWSPASVPDLNSPDDLALLTGVAVHDAGGDLFFTSGTIEIAAGGSLTQTSGIAWMQMAGGTLKVTGGTFDQGTAGNIVRNASTSIQVSAGVASFSGNLIHDPASAGALSVSGTGTINVANEFKPIADFTMNGGTLSAKLISFADGPGSVILGGGTVVLDGAGVFSGIYPGTGSFNFLTNSTAQIFFSSYTLADLAADGFLTNGRITLNGAVNAAAFVTTEVSGGVSVSLTPVPEPATALLAALGLCVLQLRPRRPV